MRTSSSSISRTRPVPLRYSPRVFGDKPRAPSRVRSTPNPPLTLSPTSQAYGELPESIRVNETDTFEEERDENDDFFDFDDVDAI